MTPSTSMLQLSLRVHALSRAIRYGWHDRGEIEERDRLARMLRRTMNSSTVTDRKDANR